MIPFTLIELSPKFKNQFWYFCCRWIKQNVPWWMDLWICYEQDITNYIKSTYNQDRTKKKMRVILGCPPTSYQTYFLPKTPAQKPMTTTILMMMMMMMMMKMRMMAMTTMMMVAMMMSSSLPTYYSIFSPLCIEEHLGQGHSVCFHEGIFGRPWNQMIHQPKQLVRRQEWHTEW